MPAHDAGDAIEREDMGYDSHQAAAGSDGGETQSHRSNSSIGSILRSLMQSACQSEQLVDRERPYRTSRLPSWPTSELRATVSASARRKFFLPIIRTDILPVLR